MVVRLIETGCSETDLREQLTRDEQVLDLTHAGLSAEFGQCLKPDAWLKVTYRDLDDVPQCMSAQVIATHTFEDRIEVQLSAFTPVSNPNLNGCLRGLLLSRTIDNRFDWYVIVELLGGMVEETEEDTSLEDVATVIRPFDLKGFLGYADSASRRWDEEEDEDYEPDDYGIPPQDLILLPCKVSPQT